MDVWVKEYMTYLERDKKVSRNTLESYRRDIVKYLNYINEQQIASFQECSGTHVLDYLLIMQKQGKATSAALFNLDKVADESLVAALEAIDGVAKARLI